MNLNLLTKVVKLKISYEIGIYVFLFVIVNLVICYFFKEIELSISFIILTGVFFLIRRIKYYKEVDSEESFILLISWVTGIISAIIHTNAYEYYYKNNTLSYFIYSIFIVFILLLFLIGSRISYNKKYKPILSKS